jgi:hypothetical protein
MTKRRSGSRHITMQGMICPKHGAQGFGLVCIHIARALNEGRSVGLYWGDESDIGRPDAWCLECEQALLSIPKGEPTDKWFMACDYEILCAVCWDEAKELALR